ncbi:TetR/AcrR family transcriptional regulator [Sporosarcina cascadiensis]|uniref:TetR/AcrR family transcriptional regulator n=1 Tax=Sporosarcina cascadiensis TaxID=2660747 RepID=UPI00129AB618|nr:TetR/AcrR family transcriptional regulator [Sporosarcina cascadiensis]
MESKAEKTKKLIVNSAIQFLLEHGFEKLTLEAVAKEAGVSKGGLLYHFPNKDALLQEIAEVIFNELQENFYQLVKADPNEEGKWTRAFIESSRLDLVNLAEQNIGKLALSLLNREAGKNISEVYRSVLVKLEDDGIDPITSTIIRLALDGIYYTELLNVAPVGKEIQDKVFQRLFQMTETEK